ncbi:biotin--[acetyl-CoA-carboxylase] ligase [Isoptericola sp. NEAU-Y5]|uniref:biotin--[biotin carboxyl-carrier protein] ligase n=1 Tax=Isoptericola luteus TaxID=2879484 RepID=A0ABS7ZEU5_9MICO|nr:biotin--[acetyl-CoA-carboxylase] ligase [Isoptericola sp. NEAU-Y5]MCA5892339.1 biotin--[acetyl-CoA-carboxylase] ligase [Isoptericola sp. NEAU-Y5]
MTRDLLDISALRRDLLAPNGPLAWLDVLSETPSTSTELVARARSGALAAPGVLVAEHQAAGRGRAGRTWATPPRAALTASFLLRPRVPASALGWLPLLAGLAVVGALRDVGAGDEGAARLKWPNDVLLPAAPAVPGFGEFRKVAGILAEVVPGRPGAPGEPRADEGAGGSGSAGRSAVVVGVGVNVSQTADELPVPTATSLALAGVQVDRGELLGALARRLCTVVGRWEEAGGDVASARLDEAYRAASATLGTPVRAELVGGAGAYEGTASRLTPDGSLVLDTPDGERVVTAGDVHHLRRP